MNYGWKDFRSFPFIGNIPVGKIFTAAPSGFI